MRHYGWPPPWQVCGDRARVAAGAGEAAAAGADLQPCLHCLDRAVNSDRGREVVGLLVVVVVVAWRVFLGPGFSPHAH